MLLDRALLRGPHAHADALLRVAERVALVGIGDPGESEPAPEFPSELLTSYLPGDAPDGLVRTQLRGAFRHAAALRHARAARTEEWARRRDLAELAKVGAALGTERDLLKLLEAILAQARRLTSSDAGSIYLVDRDDGERGVSATLRFRLAQNATLPGLRLQEFTMPVDHTSIAGYAAATGETLVIPDVYLPAEGASYRLNRSFDDACGYRSKSMLVLPLKTQRDEVIGVLQLINRKRDAAARLLDATSVEREVLPYDDRSLGVVTALAAQAAVAIENTLLYESIERLFDGFVTAAVHAIEQRDPTTYGHSERVAALSLGLADAVARGGTGRYRGLCLSPSELRELRYAALLHDFGKVGVREKVLSKRKKLYHGQLDLIRHRFAYLRQQTDLEFERARAELFAIDGGRRDGPALRQLDDARRERRAELDRMLAAILRANEPTVVASAEFTELASIGARRYRDHDGTERPLLDEEELRFLTIPRGNLSEQERSEIESHVTHTYAFLRQIPWTRELRRVPDIAYAHHEKLDGSGYPRRIGGDDIPVQARMMTIADIFDALTATDRPYKRAVPVERALDIMQDEARRGMLDAALLTTFLESRLWDAAGMDARAVPEPSLSLRIGTVAPAALR